MARILLAEDESVLRMLVVDTLEDEGHEIVEACDGQEALNKIHTDGPFDLLILDYMMPVYTGLEVVQKMTHDSKTKVLMLSAKSQHTDRERVLNAGATSFMSKPFSPLELVKKVEELLHEKN
ncbi:response regulator transcription factor [Bacillus sp. CGMCC 1.16541]|uniref:response regulator transcription factor n=1 Tax=Bacillus sp. CGMCC 1.16541 TaxID=2185143 RepID=UPI000D7253B2|nr:response regulator transcription factor [Bacillus sp. CGMCC 1.16541]